MTRDRPVRNFRGSFPDRDGIGDLTARVLENTRVLRVTHAPLGSQVVQQLFFSTPRAWMNRLRYMVSWDTRIPSSLGYGVFSHPEICSGDQSKISLLVTTSRNLGCRARRHFLGRKADSQAWSSAACARQVGRPPCRVTSRPTVEAARSRCRVISRIDEPEAIPPRARPVSGLAGSVGAL